MVEKNEKDAKLFVFLENDVNFIIKDHCNNINNRNNNNDVSKKFNADWMEINYDHLRQLSTESFVEKYFSDSSERGSIFTFLSTECQNNEKISQIRELLILHVLHRFAKKDHHKTFFADLLKSGFFHHKDCLDFSSFLASMHVCHKLSKSEIEKILNNRVNGNSDLITKNIVTFVESCDFFDREENEEFERRFKVIRELLIEKKSTLVV